MESDPLMDMAELFGGPEAFRAVFEKWIDGLDDQRFNIAYALIDNRTALAAMLIQDVGVPVDEGI